LVFCPVSLTKPDHTNHIRARLTLASDSTQASPQDPIHIPATQQSQVDPSQVDLSQVDSRIMAEMTAAARAAHDKQRQTALTKAAQGTQLMTAPNTSLPNPTISQVAMPPPPAPNSWPSSNESSHPQTNGDGNSHYEDPHLLNINTMLNPSSPPPPLILDETALDALQRELTARTLSLTVEQTEMVMARCLDVVWCSRHEWNRTKVVELVRDAVDEVILDVEWQNALLAEEMEVDHL
jgi:hypothetical protein